MHMVNIFIQCMQSVTEKNSLNWLFGVTLLSCIWEAPTVSSES